MQDPASFARRRGIDVRNDTVKCSTTNSRIPMRPTQRVESTPFGRLRTFCERVSDRWRRLDRGWQAVLLGLGIVGARLLVQAV